MRASSRAAFRSLGTVALLLGCGGANAEESGPQACMPVEEPASDVMATGLAGEYTLRLVATAGPKRGSSTEGGLDLMERDGASPTRGDTDGQADTAFSFPLHGSAELDFAAVGATLPGDAASADPSGPGVLVIQRPTGVMLRLGSEANRQGMRRFDGGYTVLQVQQVTEQGFAGTWRSAVGLEESSGHFCALKAT